MKKWIARSLALLLCAASLMLAVSAAGRAQTIYFMAVNDTPLELSSATMPIRVGNNIYVPYFIFSASSTGVNLSTYAAYNSARGQLLVYSSRRQLTFNLIENYAYDGEGTVYSSYAIIRGSTVFLPVALVCSVFSDTLKYSVSYTQYGTLVRIKSASAVLDDREFINAASSRMSSMLTRYLQENPTVITSPVPTATLTPTPTAQPTPTPAVTGRGARVYPAFTFTDPGGGPAEGMNSVLEALEHLKLQAMFFLTPEEIIAQDDLVRRLVGQGQLVGVHLTGRTAEDALRELGEAERALAAVARCRPAAVLAPALDRKGLEQLDGTGYPRWQTSLDARKVEGSAANRAKWMMGLLAAGPNARSYLLLDAGAGDTLRAVLEELTGSDFRLAAPLPTELQQ